MKATAFYNTSYVAHIRGPNYGEQHMAKKAKKAQAEGIYSYFRQLWKDNPHFLDQKSNVEVMNRYRADHNLPADAPIEASVKNAMANTKTQARKDRAAAAGEKLPVKRKGGRKKGV